jgi:hypothetical protein
MTRINAFRSIVGPSDSVAWGKDVRNIGNNIQGNLSALVFAAVLIVCSISVGCSSDKPKPVSSNTQIPVTQTPTPAPPVMLADSRPTDPKLAPKKIVHKKPATVNYSDKNTGVTFEYPRRYAIETGDAANDVLLSSPIPMNFVAPGGVALAAVELPESIYASTDFSSGFFNVSVHKGLTAEQCNEFAVPQPKVIASTVVSEKAPEKSDSDKTVSEKPVAEAKSEVKSEGTSVASTPSTETAPSSNMPAPVETAKAPEAQPAATQPEPQGSKLLIGDMELRGTEAVSGEGARQSDSKYFHVYQNGSCYEFAMNVTTVASQDGLIKHVDRDKVFVRLGQILDTVKINPVVPDAAAEAPKTPTTTAPETAAQ